MDKGFWNWFFGRGKSVVEFGLIPFVSFGIAWAYFDNPYFAALVPVGQIALLLHMRHSEYRENSGLNPEMLSAGSMSRHLAPKLRRILQGPAKFYVTEYDASPLLSWRQKAWRRFLREALTRGSSVDYVITGASKDDKQKLGVLKSELEHGTTGSIQFHFFAPGCADNDEDRIALERMQSFHPLVVEDNAGQRVMWIEGHHYLGNKELDPKENCPPNSEWAYHVEFVPPAEAAKDERYEKYVALFARLIGKYGTVREAHA